MDDNDKLSLHAVSVQDIYEPLCCFSYTNGTLAANTSVGFVIWLACFYVLPVAVDR